MVGEFGNLWTVEGVENRQQFVGVIYRLPLIAFAELWLCLADLMIFIKSACWYEFLDVLICVQNLYPILKIHSVYINNKLNCGSWSELNYYSRFVNNMPGKSIDQNSKIPISEKLSTDENIIYCTKCWTRHPLL